MSRRLNSSVAEPSLVYVDLELVDRFLSDVRPSNSFIFVVDGALQAVVIAIGIVANLLTIVVYRHVKDKTCTKYYMIALAMTDIGLMLSYFWTNAIWVLKFRGRIKTHGPHVNVIRHTYVISNFTMSMCVWLTTLVTFERYRAICNPLQHRRSTTTTRTKLSILVCVLLAILYNIPKIFELSVQSMTLPKFVGPRFSFALRTRWYNTTFVLLNETVDVLTPTHLYVNPIYHHLYRVACRVILDTVAPLAIIAILTSRMSWVLLRANRQRTSLYHSNGLIPPSVMIMRPTGADLIEPLSSPGDSIYNNNSTIISENLSVIKLRAVASTPSIVDQSSSFLGPSADDAATTPVLQPANSSVHHGNRRNSVRINIPLLLVLAKFLLCYSLPAVVTILELSLPSEFNLDYGITLLVTISNFLVVFNSATNFFVFLACGQKFRQQLKSLFLSAMQSRGWPKKNVNRLQSSNSNGY